MGERPNRVDLLMKNGSKVVIISNGAVLGCGRLATTHSKLGSGSILMSFGRGMKSFYLHTLKNIINKDYCFIWDINKLILCEIIDKIILYSLTI